VVFNDFIKDDCIPEGDGQVASGSTPLPDPVDLETDEQRLEKVENVSAVVKHKTLKGQCMTHIFSAGWSVGVVKSCLLIIDKARAK
jgi:hypothetical protein